MIRGVWGQGSSGYPFSNESKPAAVVAEFEKLGQPTLAAVAQLMLRTNVMRGEPDDQVVRAFARVNVGRSDRAGVLGAALSFSEHSDIETRAVGSLAPGGSRNEPARSWQGLFEGHAGTRYDPQLSTEVAKELFFDEERPWALLIRSPQGGHLPKPLIVETQPAPDLLVYDPANRTEGWPTLYTTSVEELAGMAAIYSSFGLLAVRPAETPIQGPVIRSAL